MSGGMFEYKQFGIGYLAEDIRNSKTDIKELNNENKVEEIERIFDNATIYLKLASIYLHEIDWYLCQDIGDQTMIENIKKRIFEEDMLKQIEWFKVKDTSIAMINHFHKTIMPVHGYYKGHKYFNKIEKKAKELNYSLKTY
jgi:hypothetical protein